MRITRLAPHRRDPERTQVDVDGVPACTLATELVLRAGLHEGDEVDPGRLEALVAEDEPYRVRSAAYSLLAVRQRTRVELRRRLLQKGFGAETVDSFLDRLESLNLVDDGAFAQAFARDRLRFRPQGGLRTVLELRGRGVDEDTAREAVAGALEETGTDEADLARQAAARWRLRDGEDRAAARRRLYAFLARRGFDGETVREVVEEVIAGLSGGDA